MYVVPPPQRSDPISGHSGGSSDLRVYQTWKGSNIFLLQGRFIFGPDARSLLLTMFLIVVPITIFCVFVAKNLMYNFSGNWGISIMVVAVVFTVYILVVLLITSGRDPGIVPRNAHPPEPEAYEGSAEGGSGQTPQLRLPPIKETEVNGVTVKIKYCDTCMLYRPPRCSHCSICNNCVEKFDHHCPWIGQCIGLRNYRFFFMFISSTTLLCMYVFSFCWVYIVSIMGAEETTIWKAMIKTPASIVLIVYTFIAMWFVGGLTAFHLYLISINQTTYQNFRYRHDQLRANVFNRGVLENFKEVFFSSIPPSKNNFRATVPRGPVLPPTLGGSFMSPNIGKGVDIEMGRKTVWGEINVGADPFDVKTQTSDRLNIKDGELGEVSPDIRTAAEDTAERAGIHPRRSSWGRKSGSWEMSPEVVALAARVGDNRVAGSSGSGNLTVENREESTRKQT